MMQLFEDTEKSVPLQPQPGYRLRQGKPF